MLLTVFTPTFNRAHTLAKVFDSLMSQTVTDFEWLIIDDGSSDSTHELVKQFDSHNRFTIRYIFKQNEGKHVAINRAAQEAQGEWIFIVDSDDYLLPDALETVTYYIHTIEKDLLFAGVVGLRGNSQHLVHKQEGKAFYTLDNAIFKDEYVDATAIEYRHVLNIKGDRAEVVRTEVLKRYPFPQYVSEKFMSEGVLWLRMAKDGYKFRWFNKIIYITEFLSDGLTRNIKVLNRKNCQSKAFFENLKLGTQQLPFKVRYKAAIHHIEFSLFAKKSVSTVLSESSNIILSLLVLPMALLHYLISPKK